MNPTRLNRTLIPNMDTDGTNESAAFERDLAYAVPELSVAPIAAEQVFSEYTVAAALEHMFAEAEQLDASWDTVEYWEQAYPSDTAAFRMFMKEVQTELKASANVQDLRQAAKSGEEITVHMVEAVFRSYERAIQAALHHLRDTISPEQLQQLRRSSRTELDWSYRDLLVEHITSDGAAPTRFAPEDFFLILNPKARKVQYMDRQEILATLRHSMAQGSKDALHHDLEIVRRYEPIDVGQEQLTQHDLESFTT